MEPRCMVARSLAQGGLGRRGWAWLRATAGSLECISISIPAVTWFCSSKCYHGGGRGGPGKGYMRSLCLLYTVGTLEGLFYTFLLTNEPFSLPCSHTNFSHFAGCVTWSSLGGILIFLCSVHIFFR